jgi:hypothetical protein
MSRLRLAFDTRAAHSALVSRLTTARILRGLPVYTTGPHTAPLLSGCDANVQSAGMAAKIVIDRNSLTMKAERGAKGDDSQRRQLTPPPV